MARPAQPAWHFSRVGHYECANMHDFMSVPMHVTIQKILSCFVVIEEAGGTSPFYSSLILQNYYAAGFGLAQFPWST